MSYYLSLAFESTIPDLGKNLLSLVVGAINHQVDPSTIADPLVREKITAYIAAKGDTYTTGLKHIYSNEYMSRLPNGIKNSRLREVFDTYRVMKRAEYFQDAARLNFIQKALTWAEYRDAVANDAVMYEDIYGNDITFADYHADIRNRLPRNYFHDFILEFLSGHSLQIEYAGFPPDSEYAPTYALKRIKDAANNQAAGSPTLFVVDSPQTKALYLDQMDTLGIHVPILTLTEFGYLMKAWIWANTLHYREDAERTDHLNFLTFIQELGDNYELYGPMNDDGSIDHIEDKIVEDICNAFGFNTDGDPITDYTYITKNYEVDVNCNFAYFQNLFTNSPIQLDSEGDPLDDLGLLTQQVHWIHGQLLIEGLNP